MTSERKTFNVDVDSTLKMAFQYLENIIILFLQILMSLLNLLIHGVISNGITSSDNSRPESDVDTLRPYDFNSNRTTGELGDNSRDLDSKNKGHVNTPQFDKNKFLNNLQQFLVANVGGNGTHYRNIHKQEDSNSSYDRCIWFEKTENARCTLKRVRSQNQFRNNIRPVCQYNTNEIHRKTEKSAERNNKNASIKRSSGSNEPNSPATLISVQNLQDSGPRFQCDKDKLKTVVDDAQNIKTKDHPDAIISKISECLAKRKDTAPLENFLSKQRSKTKQLETGKVTVQNVSELHSDSARLKAEYGAVSESTPTASSNDKCCEDNDVTTASVASTGITDQLNMVTTRPVSIGNEIIIPLSCETKKNNASLNNNVYYTFKLNNETEHKKMSLNQPEKQSDNNQETINIPLLVNTLSKDEHKKRDGITVQKGKDVRNTNSTDDSDDTQFTDQAEEFIWTSDTQVTASADTIMKEIETTNPQRDFIKPHALLDDLVDPPAANEHFVDSDSSPGKHFTNHEDKKTKGEDNEDISRNIDSHGEELRLCNDTEEIRGLTGIKNRWRKHGNLNENPDLVGDRINALRRKENGRNGSDHSQSQEDERVFDEQCPNDQLPSDDETITDHEDRVTEIVTRPNKIGSSLAEKDRPIRRETELDGGNGTTGWQSNDNENTATGTSDDKLNHEGVYSPTSNVNAIEFLMGLTCQTERRKGTVSVDQFKTGSEYIEDDAIVAISFGANEYRESRSDSGNEMEPNTDNYCHNNSPHPDMSKTTNSYHEIISNHVFRKDTEANEIHTSHSESINKHWFEESTMSEEAYLKSFKEESIVNEELANANVDGYRKIHFPDYRKEMSNQEENLDMTDVPKKRVKHRWRKYGNPNENPNLVRDRVYALRRRGKFGQRRDRQESDIF